MGTSKISESSRKERINVCFFFSQLHPATTIDAVDGMMMKTPIWVRQIKAVVALILQTIDVVQSLLGITLT